MAFVQIKPARVKPQEYCGDKVRISFPITKLKDREIQKLVLYIGSVVATRLGWEHGDRIQLFIDDENPLLWFLKKTDKNEDSWALVDIKHNSSTSNKLFKFELTWKEPVPEKCKKGVLYTNFDFFQGGLRLALPGCKATELSVL